MCLIGLSESGHGGRFEPCEECKRLQEENAELRQENQLLRAENANLSMAHGPGNHTDWMLTRASKYEQLHKDLETLRQELDSSQQDHLDTIIERDALRQERDRLAGIVEKADALLKASYMPHLEPWALDRAQKSYQEARHG